MIPPTAGFRMRNLDIETNLIELINPSDGLIILTVKVTESVYDDATKTFIGAYEHENGSTYTHIDMARIQTPSSIRISGHPIGYSIRLEDSTGDSIAIINTSDLIGSFKPEPSTELFGFECTIQGTNIPIIVSNNTQGLIFKNEVN